MRGSLTMLHIVAIPLILGGMALSGAALLGTVSFQSGPALFAAGTVLEFAGWVVALWSDDHKKPQQSG
jgi:hypothetical protein